MFYVVLLQSYNYMIIYYFIMHNNDLKKYLCSNKAIMFLKISREQSPKAVFKT